MVVSETLINYLAPRIFYRGESDAEKLYLSVHIGRFIVELEGLKCKEEVFYYADNNIPPRIRTAFNKQWNNDLATLYDEDYDTDIKQFEYEMLRLCQFHLVDCLIDDLKDHRVKG